MSDFTFSATAQCDYCGAYLSSSDESCDHDGREIKTHVFREIGGGRETLKGIRAVGEWKWHRLYDEVGSEWLKYEWLGSKNVVNSMLRMGYWDGVADLPYQAMSLAAPKEVAE